MLTEQCECTTCRRCVAVCQCVSLWWWWFEYVGDDVPLACVNQRLFDLYVVAVRSLYQAVEQAIGSLPVGNHPLENIHVKKFLMIIVFIF